jgi:5'-3' exonuclease
LIALIDGDMLLYRAAFRSQETVDFGDGEGETTLVDPDMAIREAMSLVRSWTKAAGCSRPIVCLSSVESDSFRHRLWDGYKANRKSEKPEAYAAARKALEFEYEVYAEPGLEADDLMGIAATSKSAQSVIVSGDKDMLTIPSLVFNPMKDRRPVRINSQLADQRWMYQTMIGDSVDGYPGIPGAGPKTADAILASPHRLLKTTEMVGKKKPKQVTKWVRGGTATVWQSMLDYAAKAGLSEEDVIVQAQLARILRSGDFDKVSRTVRLWRPGGASTELSL